MRNIVFVGGIHGVGKGSICREVCAQTDLLHLSASELLKWDQISANENKLVENVNVTQNRLIEGLQRNTTENQRYLLDGHFCLLNSKGNVEKVPIETFEKIAPSKIAVVIANIEMIQNRLKKRDQIIYDLKTLENLQEMEIDYSAQVASHLKTPILQIYGNNPVEIMKNYIEIKSA